MNQEIIENLIEHTKNKIVSELREEFNSYFKRMVVGIGNIDTDIAVKNTVISLISEIDKDINTTLTILLAFKMDSNVKKSIIDGLNK